MKTVPSGTYKKIQWACIDMQKWGTFVRYIKGAIVSSRYTHISLLTMLCFLLLLWWNKGIQSCGHILLYLKTTVNFIRNTSNVYFYKICLLPGSSWRLKLKQGQHLLVHLSICFLSLYCFVYSMDWSFIISGFFTTNTGTAKPRIDNLLICSPTYRHLNETGDNLHKFVLPLVAAIADQA